MLCPRTTCFWIGLSQVLLYKFIYKVDSSYSQPLPVSVATPKELLQMFQRSAEEFVTPRAVAVSELRKGVHWLQRFFVRKWPTELFGSFGVWMMFYVSKCWVIFTKCGNATTKCDSKEERCLELHWSKVYKRYSESRRRSWSTNKDKLCDFGNICC